MALKQIDDALVMDAMAATVARHPDAIDALTFFFTASGLAAALTSPEAVEAARGWAESAMQEIMDGARPRDGRFTLPD